MGNSRPFLSLIVQQATLFAILIGLGRLVSPLTDQLTVPQEGLVLITIIVSEILVLLRLASSGCAFSVPEPEQNKHIPYLILDSRSLKLLVFLVDFPFWSASDPVNRLTLPSPVK